MLVDSHAHLDDYADREEVIARARAAGVAHVVLVGQWREGAGMSGALGAIRLARTDPSFFSATAGIHPHDAARATEADFAELRRICEGPDVVAVGEAGLDFHYDHSPRDVQGSVFVRQIRLARELRKPLVVHTREADVETAEILGRELGPEGGVIHCFTSDWAAAERYLALGMYLSFSGVLTFRNAEAVRDAARRAPLDRMLVETDCPFLAPVPHRGKRNEPAYVALTAQALAGLRGLPADELARVTTENARKILRLPARMALNERSLPDVEFPKG
jgi:TatD DNase family protein